MGVFLSKRVWLSALGFSLLERVLDGLFLSAFPAYMASLRSADRRLYVSYAVSLAHALATGVGGAVLFMNRPEADRWGAEVGGNVDDKDAQQRARRHNWGRWNRFLLRVMAGYFINDLIMSYEQWSAFPTDLIHHSIAIVSIACGSRHEAAVETLPKFCIIELSTLFIDLVTLIQGVRTRHTTPPPVPQHLAGLVRALSMTFAASFLATRCVWLPRVAFWMLTKRRKLMERLLPFGLAKGLLVALQLLQFYWGRKIVNKFLLRSVGRPVAA